MINCTAALASCPLIHASMEREAETGPAFLAATFHDLQKGSELILNGQFAPFSWIPAGSHQSRKNGRCGQFPHRPIDHHRVEGWVAFSPSFIWSSNVRMMPFLASSSS